MKHEGFHARRLSNNPLEYAYAMAWKRENMGTGILEYLLSPDGTSVRCSERDAQVAATVIQWLGSPVGQQFVCEVLEYFNNPSPIDTLARAEQAEGIYDKVTAPGKEGSK